MITTSANGEYLAPLKVAEKYDVIVVGSGPSGSIAALSSARNGAKTLLIERESYLGGMMTGGSINGIGINGYVFRDASDYDGGPRPYVVEGISLEVYRRLQEAGGAIPGKPKTRGPVDSIILVHVLDEMMAEAGVTVLFNTIVFDTLVEDNKVKGVAVSNKSGGQVYYADVVVDCSADGDVAARAGCDFVMGRESDGRCHGGSLDMQIGGVDVDRFVEFMKNQPIMPEDERIKFEADRKELVGGGGEPNTAFDLNGNIVYRTARSKQTDWAKVAEEVKKGNAPPIRVSMTGGGTYPGTAEIDENGKFIPMQVEFDRLWIDYIKAGKVPQLHGAAKPLYPPPRFGGIAIYRHGKYRLGQMQAGTYECWFDHTDEMECSKALTFMRKLNKTYLNFVRDCVPGFEEAYFINEAPMIGTRESRRILGEYYVTEPDVTEGGRFDDVIGMGGPRGADAHAITGVWGDGVVSPFKAPYDVPYRCLVPLKIDNILVGGRCVSGTHLAIGGMRDMATCMVTGEGAGTAAALAAKSGVTPRNLDVKALQDALRAQGVKLAVDPSELKV